MSSRRRVAIVDDEKAITDNIEYSLNQGGFDTEVFHEGRHLLDALAAADFDLLILDVGLPDINGFDLCREVRQRSDVPVVFLTAHDSEIDRVVGLELGADDYVTKPFSVRELAARVRAVLRRTAGSSSISGVDKTGESSLQIDDSRKVITAGGKALVLSRYEYRLLKVLHERPGQVLNRQQLMDLAWSQDNVAVDRTVDTHIKTLRAKLREAVPDRAYIHTRRGEGYLYEERAGD